MYTETSQLSKQGRLESSSGLQEISLIARYRHLNQIQRYRYIYQPNPCKIYQPDLFKVKNIYIKNKYHSKIYGQTSYERTSLLGRLVTQNIYFPPISPRKE